MTPTTYCWHPQPAPWPFPGLTWWDVAVAWRHLLADQFAVEAALGPGGLFAGMATRNILDQMRRAA